MPAIQTARSFIRIKLHRDLFVDAEWLLVIVGGDSRPAQVLSHAARVAPPISQAQLHSQSVARGFRERSIEKDNLSFVPLIRLVSERLLARPITKILGD